MKTKFLFFCVMASVTCNAQTWNLSGNSNTTPPQNFIGTVDAKDLVFKTNNTEKLRISTNGRFISQGITGTENVYTKNLFFGGGSDLATSYYNTVFGLGALTMNIIGSGNLAFGTNSLSQLTNGNNNISVGVNAMLKTSNASLNVGMGNNNMEGLGSYIENVSIGNFALRREFALSTENVSFNTVVGGRALAFLKNGQNNIAIGYNSIKPITSGNDNVSIGANAGANLNTGNGNILIGSNTSTSSNSSNSELNIGNWIYGKNGIIGIGTPNVNCANCNGYRLFVKDGIKTEKVKVEIAANNGWADYVLKKDYNLMPLEELEIFINKYGHLPEVPTTEEAIKNGIELKAMNILLLKKIEELTLHLIYLNKQMESQNVKIEQLQQNKGL